MLVNSVHFAGACVDLCGAPGPSISQFCVYTIPSITLFPKSLGTQPEPHFHRRCQVLSETSKSSSLRTSRWHRHLKPMAVNVVLWKQERVRLVGHQHLWPTHAFWLGILFCGEDFQAPECRLLLPLPRMLLWYGKHYGTLCEVRRLSHSLFFFHPLISSPHPGNLGRPNTFNPL